MIMNLSKLIKMALPVLGLVGLQAQAGAPTAGPPLAPRAAAPFDLTGYWVSVVTEDWVYRMLTPAKGDITSGVPVNAESRRIAGEWDIAKDEAAGEQCKPFGAAGLMRQPGRIHITWVDDNTLKADFEAGTQTRTLNFRAPAVAASPSWQGQSVANWQKQRQARGMGGGGAFPFVGPTQPGQGGTLEVVTTNLRPGYLFKNGVPYSANTKMTEYFDVMPFPDGTPWLVVTAIIEDPTYLAQPYIVSTHFKKEREPVQWTPRPCYTAPPLTEAAPATGAR
jgi:hypothetical protein